MVMKAVQKRKGAEAIKEAKKGKVYRRKNKSKLNKLAKQRYKTMTPAEKLKFHARQIFTKAMRHGATEAEAKKVVAAWKKRRKHRESGSHAAGQKREVTAAQRQIREQIRKKSLGLQSAHQKALSKIRSAKVPPAKRAAMRQAEKASYANARKTLAGERTKAAANHKKAMQKIKPKGKFSLKSLISNFKAKPISTSGKRLVDVGAKAAKEGVANIAAKHFGTKKPAAKKAGGVTKKAPKAPAAAAAPAASPAAAPKKRGRPAKVKEAAAEAPAPKKRGRPAKAKPAAAEAAPAPKKRGRPAKAKPAAAEAAPAPKKRGRPAGTKNKPKETAAAPVKKAPSKKAAAKKEAPAAPAAEAPKKRGRPAKAKAEAAPAVAPKKRGRPAKAKAEAAPAKAPAKAKAKEKAAAKAPAKKPSAKAAAKKPAAKAAPAKKTGGAVPKVRFA